MSSREARKKRAEEEINKGLPVPDAEKPRLAYVVRRLIQMFMVSICAVIFDAMAVQDQALELVHWRLKSCRQSRSSPSAASSSSFPG